MKRVAWLSIVIVLISLSLCACGAPTPVGILAPAQSDTTPDEWAALYPREYNQWAESVHGVAFLAGNADAPGCVSCHGDPATGEIQTSAYQLSIPTRCARCHADAELMGRYGIAADTVETYRADYHGATITNYQAHSKAPWRYEAVCSDCHGSHAVYAGDDARSSVAEANLLTTCQKCHREADEKFTQASSGHLRTSAEASVLVFIVKLFYLILIPVVLGIMLLYIALDIIHRLRTRSQRHVS